MRKRLSLLHSLSHFPSLLFPPPLHKDGNCNHKSEDGYNRWATDDNIKSGVITTRYSPVAIALQSQALIVVSAYDSVTFSTASFYLSSADLCRVRTHCAVADMATTTLAFLIACAVYPRTKLVSKLIPPRSPSICLAIATLSVFRVANLTIILPFV
jgi:hypothetical protein